MTLASILRFLQSTASVPAPYGIYHLICLVLIALTTVFFCSRLRNISDRHFRITVAVIWGVFVLLEIYKQIVFSFRVDGEGIVLGYQWFVFPYQFCSIPYYVLPLVFLSKEGSLLRKCVVAFVCSFVLFAGLAVCLYPGDVFTQYVGINVQTMVHHGLMVALGVWFAVRYRSELKFSSLLLGCALFAALVTVALLMNVGIYRYLVATNNLQTCNLFFISPYFDCTLPILSSVYKMVPYTVFLVIYIGGFGLVGAGVYYLQKGVIRLFSTRRTL